MRSHARRLPDSCSRTRASTSADTGHTPALTTRLHPRWLSARSCLWAGAGVWAACRRLPPWTSRERADRPGPGFLHCPAKAGLGQRATSRSSPSRLVPATHTRPPTASGPSADANWSRTRATIRQSEIVGPGRNSSTSGDDAGLRASHGVWRSVSRRRIRADSRSGVASVVLRRSRARIAGRRAHRGTACRVLAGAPPRARAPRRLPARRPWSRRTG